MKPSFTFLLVLAAGCGLFPTENDDKLIAARLQLTAEEPPLITVPSTVGRELPFNFEFTTYASDCIETGPIRVVQMAMQADIYAMQRDRRAANVVCTDDVQIVENVVILRFSTEGTATIRLHGRNTDDQPLVVVRQVALVDLVALH